MFNFTHLFEIHLNLPVSAYIVHLTLKNQDYYSTAECIRKRKIIITMC